MAASYFGKKYKLEKSDNFEEYMMAVGVSGQVIRKLAEASPVVELNEGNSVYSFKTLSNFKNHEINFKLGEEFDQKTIDGRRVKAVITRDGNTFTEVQKQANQPVTYITWKFTPAELVIITKLDDIVCTRVYKLQE